MIAFQSILVPVDGSDNSRRAISYAGYLAELCDATINVLYVTNLGSKVAALGQSAMGGYIPGKVVDDILEEGSVIVNQALAQLPATVTARGYNEEGSPAEVIIEYANVKRRADVIVMGRRGLGMVKELLLGSVSREVLQHARCPVMIVR